MDNRDIDNFFLRAHLAWSISGFIALFFMGFNLGPLFFDDHILIWIFAIWSYFLGVFLGLNVWSLYELIINKKRYCELIDYFETTMFMGAYLKKLIVGKKF